MGCQGFDGPARHRRLRQKHAGLASWPSPASIAPRSSPTAAPSSQELHHRPARRPAPWQRHPQERRRGQAPARYRLRVRGRGRTAPIVGKINDRQLAEISRPAAIPGEGSCGRECTPPIRWVASAIEALGMSLPNSSAQDPISAAKTEECRRAGAAVLRSSRQARHPPSRYHDARGLRECHHRRHRPRRLRSTTPCSTSSPWPTPPGSSSPSTTSPASAAASPSSPISSPAAVSSWQSSSPSAASSP